MTKLIVGLGNPGKEYAQQRHNIGFMAVDAIAKECKFPGWRTKGQALLSQSEMDGEPVWLVKPQTFMNLSGQAVGALVHFHKIPLDDVYVIHDDIELIPAKVRIKRGGGHAGHNGLKSIDAAIGADYWRVRLGVGRPVVAEDVHDYVLQDFSKTERAWVDRLCDCLAENITQLWQGDHSDLMNRLVAAVRP